MATVGDHFRVEQLADGVWAAIATARGHGLCNAGIVDLGGSSLVFDAMLTPQAGDALGRTAERLTGRPVDLLVNSHYHGDHVRGTSAVRPIHVLGTPRVRELVLERGPLHLRSDVAEAARDLARLRSGEMQVGPVERAVFEGWFEGLLATPADLEFRPADSLFEREVTLRGSRRSARVLTLGGGHSPSDILVHLPDDRIGFFGDLVSVGYHPTMSDGEPFELARILGECRGLPLERALPGHGPVTDQGGIAAMQGYVGGIIERARTARTEGVDRDAFARTPPPAPYSGWAFSPFYEENARFVFDRLGTTPAGVARP